jgi:hypothetical protein
MGLVVQPLNAIERGDVEDVLAMAEDCREAFNEASNEDEKVAEARDLFHAATLLLQRVVGAEALSVLYGPSPPAEAPVEDHMLALSGRLWLLSWVFPKDAKGGSSSVTAAREEIEAIAHGDAPRLFVEWKGRPQGLPINAHRVARHQLRALEWEAFFRSQGNSAAESQLAVQNAYVTTWPRIARWKTQVMRELGQEHLDKALNRAQRGKSPAGRRVRSVEDALALLKSDGEAYNAEQDRRAVPVRLTRKSGSS